MLSGLAVRLSGVAWRPSEASMEPSVEPSDPAPDPADPAGSAEVSRRRHRSMNRYPSPAGERWKIWIDMEGIWECFPNLSYVLLERFGKNRLSGESEWILANWRMRQFTNWRLLEECVPQQWGSCCPTYSILFPLYIFFVCAYCLFQCYGDTSTHFQIQSARSSHCRYVPRQATRMSLVRRTTQHM